MQTLNNVLKSKNNEYFLSCIIWKEVLKGKLSALEIGHVTDMLDTLTYRNGLRMSKKVEASGSDAIKNFGATQNESRYMFTVILALIYSVILR